jgi:phosphatidylglycerol:prolipoprotein diacylglycerol transferase
MTMLPWFYCDVIYLGFIKLQVWGILVSLGFITGLIVAYWRFKKRKLSTDNIFDLSFWIIIGAIIGSRLLYVVEYWRFFSSDYWEIIKMWHGGMSIYGGFIGAAIFGTIYLLKNEFDFWAHVDALIFSLPLGLFIGRLGCFLIHDHPGIKTDFFLGVQYAGGARHDLGLYLSLNGLILFLVFLFLDRKKRFDGFYAVSFALWYGISRFLLDFLRANDVFSADARYLGLTLAQYLSLALFIFGVFLYFFLKKRKVDTNS